MLSEYVKAARGKGIRVAMLAATLAGLPGCGSEKVDAPTNNPVPVLLNIRPLILRVGAGASTLTLGGSGFVRGSRARWNGAERVTRYLSDTVLTLDVPASDLVTIADVAVTVVNPAPGGGTSGVIGVGVWLPAPIATAISPSAIDIPTTAGRTRVTITGAGFVPTSYVGFHTGRAITVSVTPTQVTADVPHEYFPSTGTMQFYVVNPPPLGDASNFLAFNVNYPVPSIASIAPDSSVSATSLTLTVNGSGFLPGTVVRWNGADRPTTHGNFNRIIATLAATDLQAQGTANVSIFNPSPGGGSSNVVLFRVRDPAPVITSITPATITAGSGSVTVTIAGENFRSGARALWNGQERTTSMTSSSSLTLALTAGDVAIPASGRITVKNGDQGETSNVMSAAVLSASATLSVVRTIQLRHADFAYDSARAVFYATVPDGAGQHANRVVRINASTGVITGTVDVGNNPGTLAITDDAQFLYVAPLRASKIVRIALASFTKDIEIDLPRDGDSESDRFAEDIVPIPGAPRTIAVSLFHSAVTPRHAGTALFDDASRRVVMGPTHTGANRITRTATGTGILGFNNESTEFGFRSLRILPDGLHEESSLQELLSGYDVDIEYDGGYVYATNGVVIDVTFMRLLERQGATGIVRPDAANARVHYLDAGAIQSLHYTAMTPIGSFTHPSLAAHTRLIRWGADGLAVGGGDTIVLLRGTMVAQ